MKTSVVIVGGGLSGLTTAYLLHKQNVDFILLEARSRLGGRILSEPAIQNHKTDQSTDTTVAGAVDLGPSWFWPGQKLLETLINELDLSARVFQQYDIGHSVIEYHDGHLEVGHGSASMSGSFRLDGGLHYLVDCLSKKLPEAQLITNTCVTHIKQNINEIQVTTSQHNNEFIVNADKLVLALPPRLTANSINFDPPLQDSNLQKMQSKATWMAAHAKFVAVYETPFWREQGLSGDGMSQKDPLVEIHDASAMSGGPYALFGFVGVPAIHRQEQDSAIIHSAIEQIDRMFGNGTKHTPLSTHYKDWAFDPFTGTALDRESPANHHGRPVTFTSEWDNTLLFAGSETATGAGQSNGYLEGAIESAYRVAADLQSRP